MIRSLPMICWNPGQPRRAFAISRAIVWFVDGVQADCNGAMMQAIKNAARGMALGDAGRKELRPTMGRRDHLRKTALFIDLVVPLSWRRRRWACATWGMPMIGPPIIPDAYRCAEPIDPCRPSENRERPGRRISSWHTSRTRLVADPMKIRRWSIVLVFHI